MNEGHYVSLEKEQVWLYIRRYSLSRRTITQCNILFLHCVRANRVNILKATLEHTSVGWT